MEKKKALHLANGTVYLKSTKDKEWINIDITGELASKRPDLVELSGTTIDKYYKYSWGINIDNRVTDILMDVRDLSCFKDNSIDEILSVNLIDHISREDFIKALGEWHRVLKPGGRMIIDVDNRQESVKMLVDAKTVKEIESAMFYIHCDCRDKYYLHFHGYTPEYLRSILEENKFKYIWTKNDYIIHDRFDNRKLFFQICVEKVL